MGSRPGKLLDPARPPERPCSRGRRMLRVRPGQPPVGYLGYQRDVAGLGHSSPALQPRGKREGAGTGKGLGRSSGAAGFWGKSLESPSRDWEGRIPSAPHPSGVGCFPHGNELERGSRCSRCAPCGTQDLSWHSCGTQDLSMALGVGSHSGSREFTADSHSSSSRELLPSRAHPEASRMEQGALPGGPGWGQRLPLAPGSVAGTESPGSPLAPGSQRISSASAALREGWSSLRGGFWAQPGVGEVGSACLEPLAAPRLSQS